MERSIFLSDDKDFLNINEYLSINQKWWLIIIKVKGYFRSQIIKKQLYFDFFKKSH